MAASLIMCKLLYTCMLKLCNNKFICVCVVCPIVHDIIFE